MLSIFEIESSYVDFLSSQDATFYVNLQPKQDCKSRRLGVAVKLNETDYFVPLMSHEKKHESLKEGMDLVKLGDKGVLNLNCMFPVPLQCLKLVNPEDEESGYRDLLNEEIVLLRQKEAKIKKNAERLYRHKQRYKNSTTLGRRCNDFNLLEILAKSYAEKIAPVRKSNFADIFICECRFFRH